MSEKLPIEFILVVHGATQDECLVADRIFDLILKHVNIKTIENTELSSKIYDVSSYGELETDQPCIVFGPAADSQTTTTSKLWKLPAVSKLITSDENKMTRLETFQYIKTIGPEVDELVEEMLSVHNTPKQETFVEIDGVSIGLTNTDIMITESEAEYLKRIRDLLGGGKMVITKGDLRIEVS